MGFDRQTGTCEMVRCSLHAGRFRERALHLPGPESRPKGSTVQDLCRVLNLHLERLESSAHAIVIEKVEKNYGAYVPDLPGCVATGKTIEATEREIREAIEFHLRGLREDGLPIPEPSSRVDYVEVAA